MYEAFYGFREPPFRVTPDPRFLYRNAAIEEAVAALTYGVEQRKGFLSLVGEVGTGKTTLLRHLLELGRAHHPHRSPALPDRAVRGDAGLHPPGARHPDRGRRQARAAPAPPRLPAG